MQTNEFGSRVSGKFNKTYYSNYAREANNAMQEKSNDTEHHAGVD
jgi:hypothetical protein